MISWKSLLARIRRTPLKKFDPDTCRIINKSYVVINGVSFERVEWIDPAGRKHTDIHLDKNGYRKNR